MASDPSKKMMIDVRCIDEIIGFIKKREPPSPTSVSDTKSFNYDDEGSKQDLRKRVNAAAMLFLENVLRNTLTITEYNYRMTVRKADVEAALRYVVLVDVPPVEIGGTTADSELDVDDEEYCVNGEEEGNEDDEELEEDFHNQDEDEGDDVDDEVLTDEVGAAYVGVEAKKKFDEIFPPLEEPIFFSDKLFNDVVLGPIIEGFRVSAGVVPTEAAGLIKQTMYAYIVGSMSPA
ncbi:hypothetical protein HJC23_004251 [Cyclotella cryptica]|uniref:Histone H2A/H2B/H3 domain-containing protein n=1 Tax=Cyclotella cryptica TaxID=29204 RepID=A0ABD3Q991_9STRA